MTKERYESVARWFVARPRLLKLMKALNKTLPGIAYVAYPSLAVYLAILRDARLWRVLIVPAVVFVGVSVLRKCLNFQRPYEKLGITPLINREGGGQSFPSRHAASATVIAAAFLYVWPPAGAVMSAVALMIAVIRPLGGLHFPRDIAAGVLIGIAAGITGFLLIL